MINRVFKIVAILFLLVGPSSAITLPEVSICKSKPGPDMLAVSDSLAKVQMAEIVDIARKAIRSHVKQQYPKHQALDEGMRWFRTMYDEERSLYRVEFYDLTSFISSLWLGNVVVDPADMSVVEVDDNVGLYSGISPEMALEGIWARDKNVGGFKVIDKMDALRYFWRQPKE